MLVHRAETLLIEVGNIIGVPFRTLGAEHYKDEHMNLMNLQKTQITF